jgi:hypothetical protein
MTSGAFQMPRERVVVTVNAAPQIVKPPAYSMSPQQL